MTEGADVPPDLTVLILSYNVRPYLALALRTAFGACRSLRTEIIVVDNASPDGSADMVETDFPDARLIRSPHNVGFSAGNNIGIKAARGRYVLLLNPDVLVHPDAFEAIVSYLDSHPDVGAAGGRIVRPDGSSDPGARRGFPSASAAFYRMVGLSYIFPHSPRFAGYNMSYRDEDRDLEVDAVSGCFMCVRRKVIEAVGALDERFFMYGEDLDWSYRIRSAGWKIAYVPRAEIVHFKGESTRSLPRLRQLYEFHRAMHIFVQKHITPKQHWIINLIIETGIFVRGFGVTVWRLLNAALVPILDTGVIALALVLALVLRMQTGWTLPPFNFREWMLVGFVFIASWVIGAGVTGLYGRRRLDVRRAVIAAGIGGIACVLAIFFIRTINFSRIVTGLTWILTVGLVWLWRRLALRNAAPPLARWLVLGCGENARRFIESLRPEDRGIRIIGVVRGHDDAPDCRTVAGYPVLGDTSDLPLLLRRLKADELIVAWERSYQYSGLLKLVRGGGRYPRRVRLLPDAMPATESGSPEDWPLIDLDLHKRTWL